MYNKSLDGDRSTLNIWYSYSEEGATFLSFGNVTSYIAYTSVSCLNAACSTYGFMQQGLVEIQEACSLPMHI